MVSQFIGEAVSSLSSNLTLSLLTISIMPFFTDTIRTFLSLTPELFSSFELSVEVRLTCGFQICEHPTLLITSLSLISFRLKIGTNERRPVIYKIQRDNSRTPVGVISSLFSQ